MTIKMSNEAKLGLLALVVLIVMVWGYRFLKGKNLLDNSNTYYITYSQVDELTASSPVFINGYQVGSVTKVSLKPDDVEKILVQIEVDGEIQIPKTAKAILSSSGIMGGKNIILDYGNEDMANGILPHKSYIEGGSRGLLNAMVDADEIDVYFEKLKTNLSGLFDTLSQSGTSEESLMESVKEFQATIKNLSGISENLNRMIAVSYSSIDKTLDNVAVLSETIKASGPKIENIINNLDAVSTDLKEAEINKTLKEAEGAIAEVKTSLVSIQGTVKSAESAIDNINKLIAKAESGDGTLGSLINDPALYENLEQTSKNLDLLLQDLRLNPKRYINVSVFGKKQQDYVLPDEDPVKKQEEN